MPDERLQKILAQAGIASRRKAEEYILGGRVTVNRVPVTELGAKADLEKDEIRVDGQVLKPRKTHLYIALHKPKEVMTTLHDPEGRKTVKHLIRGIHDHVFYAGRLDYMSEGLLLLTTDGEFARKVTAPGTHLEKTYVVKVTGRLTPEQEIKFRKGVPLYGRKTAPAKIKLLRRGENPWYEVKLTEGRQNQIRDMFKSFGLLVEKLRRVKIGFLTLEGLPPRAFRTLTREEVAKFRKILGMDDASKQA
jgi:23S rRNA pseudouridine2605 synthase